MLAWFFICHLMRLIAASARRCCQLLHEAIFHARHVHSHTPIQTAPAARSASLRGAKHLRRTVLPRFTFRVPTLPYDTAGHHTTAWISSGSIVGRLSPCCRAAFTLRIQVRRVFFFSTCGGPPVDTCTVRSHMGSFLANESNRQCIVVGSSSAVCSCAPQKLPL